MATHRHALGACVVRQLCECALCAGHSGGRLGGDAGRRRRVHAALCGDVQARRAVQLDGVTWLLYGQRVALPLGVRYVADVSWRAALHGNLLPVTLGNFVGDGLLVCMLWFVALGYKKVPPDPAAASIRGEWKLV